MMPRRVRPELVARLRAGDTEAPRSAFYELAVGEVLRAIGNVQYEPDDLPCKGKPDWVVSYGRQPIVVEVATLEEATTSEERLRKEILCKVAELTGPWWIMIDWQNSTGVELARPRVVKTAVESALASLTGGLPTSLMVPVGPHVLALRVHKKVTSAGSIIGADATRSIRMNPGEEAIKERITKKAKRYKGLKRAGIPFVVAVCTDDTLVDDGNFFRALFGRERVAFALSTSAASPVPTSAGLDGSGLLTPGPSGAIATTVSEAWFVRRSGIRGRLALTITRAPNPWAANPTDWRPRKMAVIGHRHLKRATRFSVPRRTYRVPLDKRARVDESSR
jgi:hypothetical protein